MNKYHIVGNEFVLDTVPEIKQIEEITTNNPIECTICYKNVTEYVSVIDAYRYDNDIMIPLGYCCYPCADRNTLNHLTAYMTQDGKRYIPKIVDSSVGSWINYRTMKHDPEYDWIKERDKYRKRVKRVHELAVKYNMLPKKPTKESKGSNIKQLRVEWNEDTQWALMMKMGEGVLYD
jgi:hypothetical protein